MGCVRRAVCRAAMMVAVLGFAILGSASMGAAWGSPEPDTLDQRKYYVVQPSDYLYQIAVDTLGDGNRYPEIFALNSGREQSDGGRLTDPLTIEPGWVLVLPSDADGRGVLTTPPASPAARPSAPPAAAPPPGPTQRRGTVPVAATVTVLVAIASLVVWMSVSSRPRAVVTGIVAGIVRGGRDRFPRRAWRRDRVPPAATSAEHAPPLTATLTTVSGTVGVELAAPARGGQPSYRWLADSDPLPDASLPVVLGVDKGSRLFVDLADCPYPFTIPGNSRDCRRYATWLALQLLAHGRLVQVVGDVLGDDEPAGCERLTTMPALSGLTAHDQARLVITAGLRGRSLADLRQCLRQDDRRVAVIVLGDVLRSPWSISMPPRGVEAESAPEPAAVVGATP